MIWHNVVASFGSVRYGSAQPVTVRYYANKPETLLDIDAYRALFAPCKLSF